MSERPSETTPKRPNKGITSKEDAYPSKPGFDSREHYKNAEQLKREINPTAETKPKAVRVNPKHFINRNNDLEELVEVLQAEIAALKKENDILKGK